jgi:hypothetical protein
MWPAGSALRSVGQPVVVRLSGVTFVTMVKTADLRNRDHTACGRGCDRTRHAGRSGFSQLQSTSAAGTRKRLKAAVRRQPTSASDALTVGGPASKRPCVWMLIAAHAIHAVPAGRAVTPAMRSRTPKAHRDP